jgi:MFS family permease
MLSLIAASIVAGRILTKLSYRAIMGMSMFIMALGFVMMSQMGVDTSKLYVVLSMIVVGLGIGPLMPTLNIAVQSSVDAKVRGLATSFVPFFRTIGATIGISIMGSILTKRMTTELASLHEKLPDVPPDQLKQFANPQLLLDLDARAKIAPDILQQLQAVFSDAVDRVFFAGLLFVVLGLIACFFIGKARMTSGGKKREEGAGKEASIPRPEPEMI